MKQPNIVFVFADQLRYQAHGYAGDPNVKTPNLDKLAGESLNFSTAVSGCPVCTPARASLITGQYTENLDMFSNTGDFDLQWPTVMQYLQKAGYETASFGKTHYHGYPSREMIEASDGCYDLRRYTDFVERFGWDYVMEEFDKYVHASSRLRSPYTDYLQEHGLLGDYRKQIKGVYRLTPTHWRGETSCIPQEHDLTSFIGNHAIRWLTDRTSDRPFLLKIGFVQPHVPLIDDPTWADVYQDSDIPLPHQHPAEAPNDAWQAYLDVLNNHSQIQTMSDEFIQTGIRHYLGMVSLIDQKIGEVISLLESQDLLDDTWIIYSADHGEMLGEHHLWAKMNFYKDSVQVPLILRPPSGGESRVVEELVELVDITATLADIGEAESPKGSRGQSLLPALEDGFAGKEFVRSRISHYSAVRDNRYRFTMDVTSNTPCELFDLETDPGELSNVVNSPGYSSVIDRFTKAIANI